MNIRPERSAEIESIVQERLRAALSTAGSKETVTVEWRDETVHLPVISMPVDLLFYNPATHRIKAQRSMDEILDAALDSHPYGTEAQNYLHTLLKGDPSDPRTTDPAFELLKEDLRDHGQSDPGLITRWGELINGNTRRAALAELQVKNIRVGVLPEDAGAEDIRAIELALQLRRDHKREYSFMNELLAIDERVADGRPIPEIMAEFRIRQSKFDRSRWILSLVREIIERSQIDNGRGTTESLKLVDFEAHKGKLEELYRTYTTLKTKDPEQAEAMREQKILALVLNKSKTDLRFVEANFVEKYAKQLLPAVNKNQGRTLKVPGLNIDVPGPSAKVEQLRQLTDEVLRAKVVEASGPGVDKAALEKATDFLTTADSAIDDGLTRAGKDGRVLKKKLGPTERLSEVNDAIESVITAVAEARATGNFDPDALDDLLLTMKSNLSVLSRTILRGQSATTEGTEWLEKVVLNSEADYLHA